MPLQEINPTQASALATLKAALQSSAKDFACKGVVPSTLLDVRDLLLYFQDPNSGLR